MDLDNPEALVREYEDSIHEQYRDKSRIIETIDFKKLNPNLTRHKVMKITGHRLLIDTNNSQDSRTDKDGFLECYGVFTNLDYDGYIGDFIAGWTFHETYDEAMEQIGKTYSELLDRFSSDVE